MKKYLLLSIAFLVVACTDPKGAKDQLEDSGYKDITITGYDFFGCAKDDQYHTGFEATSQNGHRSKGVVCAGLFFKGGTIRVYGRVE